MKIQKKHLIIGGLIGATMLTSAFLYWQYTKLMEYCISLKKVKLNKFNLQNADIDLSLNFGNNSNLTIEIVSQDYTALINDKQVVKVSNPKLQTILPKSKNEINLNISFSPSKLLNVIGSIAKDILLSPEKVSITIIVNIKVKLYFLKFNIPYEYKTNLKELMSNKQTNESTSNTKKC